MSSNNLMIGVVTDVGTSQLFPLGLLFEEPAGFGSNRDPATTPSVADRGERLWIYVYNDSGSTLAAGQVCIRKSATLTYAVRASLTTTSPGLVIGVAQHAIVTGSYGWILKRGLGEVLTDAAGSAADVGLMPSNATAGTAEASAANQTTPTFGWATETVVSGLATSWINCLG